MSGGDATSTDVEVIMYDRHLVFQMTKPNLGGGRVSNCDVE